MKKIQTIALVAPSGNIKNLNELNQKISILEKNFKIKKFYDETKSFGYLSDTVENRIKYFENAFLDNEVDLIISIRGGFGAIEIVDLIDYQKIKNTNKIYLGSSDATILLMALSKKTSTKCFNGLMISNGFVENLKKNIEIIEKNAFKINLEKINNKEAKGKLWGGNLSSIVSMLSGEFYLPDDEIILFIEDLNEPLYKIDKMLYEIYRCEKLRKKIKGIIFGDFYTEKNEITPLIEKYTKIFDVASFLTFDITHKENNITLPYLKEISIG